MARNKDGNMNKEPPRDMFSPKQVAGFKAFLSSRKDHKPRDTHAIAKKAAATRKAHGSGLSGNLARAGAHAKR